MIFCLVIWVCLSRSFFKGGCFYLQKAPRCKNVLLCLHCCVGSKGAASVHFPPVLATHITRLSRREGLTEKGIRTARWFSARLRLPHRKPEKEALEKLEKLKKELEKEKGYRKNEQLLGEVKIFFQVLRAWSVFIRGFFEGSLG